MTTHQVQHFPDAAALAAAAAAFLLTSARAAVRARGRFSLVLAGGRTPESLYRLLAAPPLVKQIPWSSIHIFQGDERCVPPDHPASNYRLAAASLLSPGLIPAANIHRMRGEEPDPSQAAVEYQRQVEEFLAGEGFDLVLLGMGPDGHIASLFPGSPWLKARDRLVAAVTEPTGDPPLPRLTLTLPAINQAASALIMVTGPEKARIVDEIMRDRQVAADKYPAALVAPRDQLCWLVGS